MMARLSLLLLLLLTFDLAASEAQYIHAKPGSDLHFKVPEGVEFWDLYAEGRHVGNHHGHLKAFNGYNSRLQFDSKSSVVTLQNWTKGDGLNFRVAVQRTNDNHQPTSHDVHYKILLEEHATFMTRAAPKNVFSSSSCLHISSNLLMFLVLGIFCFHGDPKYHLGYFLGSK